MSKETDAKTLNASCHGWYPEEPNELKDMVYSFLDKVETTPCERPIALIEPHAGLAWSGQTAAYGYKELLSREIKYVFILGPSHRLHTDKLILPQSDYFKTPLGKIEIDKKIKEELLETEIFQATDEAFYNENSIELQIPFLQVILSDFKIIPIVVGQLNIERVEKAAEILKNYVSGDSIFIISSDFTHYGYRYDYVPFNDNIKENIRRLDYGAIEKIENLDHNGFLKYIQKTQATICGRIPIAILLSMLPKDTKARVIRYDTLGEMTGDFSTSISYVTIGFYNNNSDLNEGIPENRLTEEEKKSLLKLSRAVLESYIREKKIPKIEDLGIKLTENLKKNRGAFVTLHKKGQLRGCIGEILPRKHLYQVVIERTIDAAVNDFRFTQVTAGELDKIEIEISALTPPRKIDDYKDIVIGRDGILLKKGSRGAVFLPQVAPEQGWDLDTTLSHLSYKAGLSPHAYKEGTSFEVFQAEVFSEE
ncbi:MAG: AmmeMemoRadiSam system protein B [Candidatus Kaelpia imicola]|nr:AmmeMemoRadiSam system protein B [Candidatus Kaelpia imicola]